MKRLLLLMLMFAAVAVHAQELQEVVYLKNGSIVKGVIIEQVPNVSLKIQTADGSVFAYPMDDIEKITKEAPVTSYRGPGPQLSAGGGMAAMAREYGLRRGYRGFVHAGYNFGVGEWSDGEGRVELQTSHGYQIMPYLFTGLGAGVEFFVRSGNIVFPLYAHLRGMLPVSRVCQPFVDFKIGYTVGDFHGFYMNPSIGCRFAVSELCGLSLSLGYTLQEFEISWAQWSTNKNYGAFTIMVGFDF